MDSLKEILKTALYKLEDNAKHTDELSGIPSGFPSLDRVTGGWENSDLIVIASRPGMGKTALVLSIARNVSVEFKIPTLFISLEMSGVQIANRLLCIESEIVLQKIRTGKLEDVEWMQLDSKIKLLVDVPLFFQTKLYELSAIKNECQEFLKNHKKGVIIIDNLQQIINSEKQYNSRDHELGDIVRELKMLAKTIDLPIIITSSLNRSVETRGGYLIPKLNDLKDSGEIENVADLVIFIHRPEHYGITQDEDGNSTRGLATLIIAKSRYGVTCDVNMHFRSEFGRFEEWDLSGVPTFFDSEKLTSFESSMNSERDSASRVNNDPPF